MWGIIGLLNAEQLAITYRTAWIEIECTTRPSHKEVSVCVAFTSVETEKLIMWGNAETQKYFLPVPDTVKQWNNHADMGIWFDPVSGVYERFLYERTRQIKDIVLCAITSLCVPFGMNNKGYSPCLSFNSIFTPCQMHLGAFHHHCSPSATFSSMVFVLTVNVWWTPQ